jgi:retinoid hydroxylase
MVPAMFSETRSDAQAPDLAGLPTPPVARGLPLLGETLGFLRAPDAFTAKHRARYGSIFAAELFGKPTVFMHGAAANHWIFAGEGKVLENQWLPATRKLLGQQSLSLISGSEHKQRRKLLAPYFKRTSMAGCVPGMLAVTQDHLRRWATDAELGPLTIVPRMRSLAFEIAANYVLGTVDDLGCGLDELARDFNTWTAGMFVPVPLAIPGSKFARALDARRRMFALLEDLVARRDASGVRGPEILSALLEVRDEDGRPLPRSTVVDELQLLLFAGHDTTVTGTTNLLYHLAREPEVRARAQAEQDAVPASERAAGPNLEQVRAMTYLDAVIKESMRLIPPIGGAFRVMLEDAEFGGFRIPKGWRIAVGPRSVHWEPEYFAEPERFDPERWLGPDERPPFSYIPFGGGPRVCVGQHFATLQMQLVTALLLRRFDWTLAANQDLSFTSLPMPLPRSGLLLELAARQARA